MYKKNGRTNVTVVEHIMQPDNHWNSQQNVHETRGQGGKLEAKSVRRVCESQAKGDWDLRSRRRMDWNMCAKDCKDNDEPKSPKNGIWWKDCDFALLIGS